MVARSWIVGCLVLWTAGCAQQPVTVRADAPDAPDPAVAASADVDPETLIERSDSTHLLAPKQVVRIDNPFGDVRIRFGGYESQLEWRGVAQNAGSEHKPASLWPNVPCLNWGCCSKEARYRREGGRRRRRFRRP